MLKLNDLHIGFRKGANQQLLFKTPKITFDKGDFIGLIGPNGSGKTTFFNTLLGENNSLSGKIDWKNKEWTTINKKEKVKLVSFVPSRFSGVQHLTGYDLLEMGRAPYTNLLGKLSPKDNEVIDEVIQLLNLQKIIYSDTSQMSDGERQIIMIGKALVQDTEVIILDEPTAFLDYKNRIKILELLQKTALTQQKIIFISSHDLEFCFNYCTKIIGIDSTTKQLNNYDKPFIKEKIITTIF